MMMKLWFVLMMFSIFITAAPPRWTPDRSLATFFHGTCADFFPEMEVKCSIGEVCEVNHWYDPVCVCKKCNPVTEPTQFICDTEDNHYINRCEVERQQCMTGRRVIEVGCNIKKIYLYRPCRGRGKLQAWFFSTVSSYTLHIGENRTIICEANGIPKPDVEWRMGTAPVPSDGGEVRANGSRLFITLATSASVGTYTCVAMNCASFSRASAIPPEPATHTVKINVVRDESCIDVPGLRPARIKPFYNRNYTVEQQLIIKCETTGLPRANVEWYKYQPESGLLKVVPDENVLVRGETLIIRYGLKAHQGYYMCKAWNCKNEIEQWSTILLRMVPETEQFYDNCLQKTWDEKEDCNLPDRDVWIYDARIRKCVLKNNWKVCPGMFNVHSSKEVCDTRCMAHCDQYYDSGDDDYLNIQMETNVCGDDYEEDEARSQLRCAKECHQRNQIIKSKIIATRNYTRPDNRRETNCPVICDQAIVNGYCNDDFIIKVRPISTQTNLWFHVRVVSALYVRQNTSRTERVESFLVHGATVQFNMGKTRSCRCPDVDSVLIAAQDKEVLMSGKLIDDSFYIMKHSIFKLHTISEERNAAFLHPEVCQLLVDWENNDKDDIENAKVRLETDETFRDKHGFGK